MSSPTVQTSNPPLNESLQVVAAAAVAELNPIWKLKPADIAKALPDVLPGLVNKWGLASAAAAADWYDELRETEAIPGRFTAIVPPLDNLGPEALAGWAAQPLNNPKAAEHAGDEPIATPKSGLRFTDASDSQSGGLRFLDEPVDLDAAVDVDAARSRAEGGLQKRLVNAANLTVTTSSAADPKSRGWMRVTRPNACDFCVLVASRGGVYTKATATFACHESCFCTARPSWGGEELSAQPYVPSVRQSSPADRDRVRKWIKENLK